MNRSDRRNAEEENPSDLARRATVRELVAAFRDAEATVRRCFAQICDAQDRLNAAFTLDRYDSIRIEANRHAWGDSFDDADACIDLMSRQAWGRIVERLELRRMMSIKRWHDLEKELRDGALPPITEENVASFAQGYLNALPEMLTDAVAEVFNWLRPLHNEYKTNSDLEVGQRVILRWVVGPGFRVSDSRQQNILALENVFNALDGRGQIAKTYRSALENAIEACGPSGRGETDLFRFRCFRNRNLHLEFKRLDLLAKFNQIAGGRNLRPAKEVA